MLTYRAHTNLIRHHKCITITKVILICYLSRKHLFDNNTVSIMTRLWAGLLSDAFSIPACSRTFLSPPKCLNWFYS